MLIVFHGVDRPDSSELRASSRLAHLEFHAERFNLVGGPLVDAAGNTCGSLIIFEAPDIKTATGEMAADPYVTAGLFETVSITEFTVVDWPTTSTV